MKNFEKFTWCHFVANKNKNYLKGRELLLTSAIKLLLPKIWKYQKSSFMNLTQFLLLHFQMIEASIKNQSLINRLNSYHLNKMIRSYMWTIKNSYDRFFSRLQNCCKLLQSWKTFWRHWMNDHPWSGDCSGLASHLTSIHKALRKSAKCKVQNSFKVSSESDAIANHLISNSSLQLKTICLQTMTLWINGYLWDIYIDILLLICVLKN